MLSNIRDSNLKRKKDNSRKKVKNENIKKNNDSCILYNIYLFSKLRKKEKAIYIITSVLTIKSQAKNITLLFDFIFYIIK